MLPRLQATRYVTPLREGGSLPGLMEADDLGTYVVKFSGAGQGRAALIAEVISGRIGQLLGLPIPQLAVVQLDPALADNEPDEEVQALLRASGGPNLGVDFLPGSLDLDTATFGLDPDFAGRLLWFDAYLGNVDRTWRNPNLLRWHGAPYLIDHGATLTFHHSWDRAAPWRGYQARDHVALGCAPDLDAADAAFSVALDSAPLRSAIEDVPSEWLADTPGFTAVADVADAYLARLRQRLADRAEWLTAIRDSAADVDQARRADPAPRSRRPAWLDQRR